MTAAWQAPFLLRLAPAKAAGAAVAGVACRRGSNSMPVELRNHAPPLLALSKCSETNADVWTKVERAL